MVHHKDGDPNDNRPEHLEVLASQRVHMIVHHYERREVAGIQRLFQIEVFIDE